MKRSGPIARRKPLKRGQPPRRSQKPIAKQGNYGRKRHARYAAYLKSPEWAELRLQALIVADFRCERCGEGILDRSLDVHHKTYKRFGGKELPTDLEVLCTFCHRAHHAVRRFA